MCPHFHMFSQPISVTIVIAVQESEQLSLGKNRPHSPCLRYSSVSSLNEYYPRIAAGHFANLVLLRPSAIIKDEEFEVGKRLFQNTGDRSLDVSRSSLRRNDYGYCRPHRSTTSITVINRSNLDWNMSSRLRFRDGHTLSSLEPSTLKAVDPWLGSDTDYQQINYSSQH